MTLSESGWRKLAAGSVAVALSWCANLYLAWVSPSRSTFDIATDLAVFAAVACAITLLIRPPQSGAPTWSDHRTMITATVVALLCGGLVWLFGHRHIGGFDHSALIDVGWRQVSGQRLFKDFPSTLPIGFVLGTGWAFSLLGVSWSAIVGWQAMFVVLTFLWSFGLLWRITRRPIFSLAVALALQSSTNLVTAYWWYNPATTTAAALFFISAAGFWRQPRSTGFGVSYVASLWLLASMKPNVAGILIVGVTATSLFSPPHRVRAIAYSAAAFLLFLGMLAAVGTSLREVCDAYLSISGRGLSLQQFLQDLTSGERWVARLLGILVAIPWLAYLRFGRCTSGARLLAAGPALAGLVGYLTNGESKLVDLPLPLLALWWLKENDDSSAGRFRHWWASYVNALVVVLIVAGLTTGLLRTRVRSIGMNQFFDYQVMNVPLQQPFFRGVEGSRALVAAERTIARTLKEEKPGRVFFGNRLQWAYAAFGQPSPRNQPAWWHPGVTHAAADEARYTQAWREARHDLLIILNPDPANDYLPAGVRESIRRDYEELPSPGGFGVYRLRRSDR